MGEKQRDHHTQHSVPCRNAISNSFASFCVVAAAFVNPAKYSVRAPEAASYCWLKGVCVTLAHVRRLQPVASGAGSHWHTTAHQHQHTMGHQRVSSSDAPARSQQADQKQRHINQEQQQQQPLPAQAADKQLEHRHHRESAGSSEYTTGSHCGVDGGEGDAQVYIPAAVTASSIYNLYSPRRRNTILLAAAFTSILVPFCDTIYLPALAVSLLCVAGNQASMPLAACECRASAAATINDGCGVVLQVIQADLSTSAEFVAASVR